MYNRDMKSFYNISVGQLITLWIFGVIAWFFALAPAIDDSEPLAVLFFAGIPCFLIFYNIGWNNYRKHNRNN